MWQLWVKELYQETLIHVARTSLRTKVHAELADLLTEAVVDAVLAIARTELMRSESWNQSKHKNVVL